MNIRTNYPVRQAQINSVRNNNTISSPQESQSRTISDNQVSFTGWTNYLPNRLKPALKRTIKMDGDAKDFLYFAGQVLNIGEERAEQMIKGKTMGHMSFLDAMVEKINTRNFYRKAGEPKDNTQAAIDLFNRIAEPQREHIGFIRSVDLSMDETKKCFDKCADDPKKLSDLAVVYGKLGQTKDRNGITMQIIDSPNTQEYVENIEKYLPHFRATEKPEGLIASLDRTLGTALHDVDSLAREKSIDELLLDFPKTSALSKKQFLENFNQEGRSIVSLIRTKMSPTEKSLEEGDAKGILKIYNSTTPENAEFRTNFLEANYFNFGRRERLGENEINELSALFELADKDPNAMKFLSTLSADGKGLGKAGDYFKLIDMVGSERLSKETKTVKKLIIRNPYDTSENVLEYYANTPESKISKLFTSVKGLFGSKKAPQVPTGDIVTIEPMTKVMKKVYETPTMTVKEVAVANPTPKKPYIAPETKVIPMEQTSILPTGKLELAKKPYITPEFTVKEVAPAAVEAPAAKEPEKAKRTYLNFTPYVPQAPNAKKLAVIKDVNGVIEKKLGAKTLEEQSGIYADKATKMRLNMLPEIFESIKDTRAAERANGTFSRSKSVSNSDAVDLYTRINGKNKRLVNYMLKKRNADGTRMFSVKDIMETLADANRAILKGKENSTKANRFTAKDEKAIYDSITDRFIEEHGKLTRAKKASVKKK